MKRILTMSAAVGTALAVLVLVVAALAPLTTPSITVQTAKADSIGGVLGQNPFPPVLDGKRVYTSAVLYTDAVNVASWGSVQVMANNVTTAGLVMTVTPQFSLQPLPCANVTQWFTATAWLTYQPYSVSSNSNTITETVGPWQAAEVVERFTVSGPAASLREFSVLGTCLRVKLDFTAGQRYTPTVVIRALNRN